LLVLAPSGNRRWSRRILWLLALAGVAMAVLTLAKATIAEGKRPDLSGRSLPTYNGLDEYRTRWTPHHVMSRTLAERGSDCVNGRLSCAKPGRTSSGIAWRTIASKPGRYRLPLYYFPAWRLTIDGHPVAIDADPATGLVRAELPAGPSLLDFSWQPLPQERAGLAISVAMLLGLILVASARSATFRSHKRDMRDLEPVSQRTS